MATIPERIRQTIAVEEDDYFSDDLVLYYANKSQRRITSYAIKQEENTNKSLRVLDKLRKYKELDVGGLTFTDEGNYYSVDVDFPTASGEEINQFNYLKYSNGTPLREITQNNLINLDWGNLVPDSKESYYLISTDSSSNPIFKIFLESDDSGTTNKVKVYYVVDPTDLESTDSSLPELPDQLENAVVYGASIMMLIQESVRSTQSSVGVKELQTLYNEELQANIY